MMSNEEEKRCPLCAEEMDWTDQQFKPCQCGYQVCVWCWHHIIDMAEKDESEGRCPACRSIYEKDKIVAMQANCERMVAKNSNRKIKPPKAKPKPSDVKKDLTNVRVIQRKMAYVIGLPLSLADEDLLQKKEYFGQYGKVTKVSLSRTAGGALQQFVNDTCSVYITYSKEEEALRCIQSVHGFVLEGRILRASYGTAKYCHAWLKNLPCNNAVCLYLHSIGADEDSFGKDEVAAVHTRSRVQQMVGVPNNVVKRSGNVLPPPLDDLYSNAGTFLDKFTVRSPISDASNGSESSIGDIALSKEREGDIAVPHKMTTFVDIVGRSNCSVPEKDGNIPEDRRILNSYSEFSSVTTGGDKRLAEPCSIRNLFKVSSSNCIRNGLLKSLSDVPLRVDSSMVDNRSSKDASGSSQKICFLHPPPYTANILEDSDGPAFMHKKTQSLSDICLDHNAVHNREDKASLPMGCVNVVSNDACQEMKFQDSAKSDRIYRSSNSFSNEEIVEHLRRIDDDSFTNYVKNSAFEAVESSIISNIMSIDFDSCENSLAMPSGPSELLDESHDLHGSSWNSLNSNKLGCSFLKQDGFANRVAGSTFPVFGDNKQQYFHKPQYSVTRTSAPPGFSLPSRDPSPVFSSSERTGYLTCGSQARRAVNAPSLSITLLQPSSTGYSTSSNNIDFIDSALSSYANSKPINGLKNPGFAETPQLSAFDDDARLWLLMQQSASAHQHSKFSQMFAPRSPSGPMGNALSGLGNAYGLSSALVDQHQNYDSSSFAPVSQHKYANGYRQSLGDVQRKGEVGMTGYGDLMLSSGDVYTRVFGL